jgi:hypothetical protein
MAELARGDLEQLLRFIAEAESIGGDEPFTPDLLAALGRLVHADDVSYSELDRVRRRRLLIVGRPDDEDAGVDSTTRRAGGCYWRRHPLCLRQQRDMRRPVKLSDFLTKARAAPDLGLRQLLRTFDISTSSGADSLAALAHEDVSLRSQRRPDFTERDRLLLDLLQPHLARIWLAARTHRLLSSALAELDRVDEHDRRG